MAFDREKTQQMIVGWIALGLIGTCIFGSKGCSGASTGPTSEQIAAHFEGRSNIRFRLDQFTALNYGTVMQIEGQITNYNDFAIGNVEVGCQLKNSAGVIFGEIKRAVAASYVSMRGRAEVATTLGYIPSAAASTTCSILSYLRL